MVLATKFLITSFGRTGTAWLAWVMNHSKQWDVRHESLCGSGNVGVVAPSYIMHLEHYRGLTGIVLRNPIHAVISNFNYAATHDISEEENTATILKMWPLYHKLMAEALDRKAILLHYPRFNSVDYVQSVCQAFGINDITVEQWHLAKSVNAHPSRYATADDLPEQAVEYLMGEPMQFWLEREHSVDSRI